MDRLIYEANARFLEKSVLVTQDQTVSFSTFTDRSYSLRVQMAGTAWLGNDAHFCEMLAFVEKYTAVDDNLRGDVDKRLNALLAGLLKGLLRECLSLQDIGGKKIALERVHSWFQEKCFDLLDQKMKRRGTLAQSNKADPSVVSETLSVAEVDAPETTNYASEGNNIAPKVAWVQAPVPQAPQPQVHIAQGPTISFLQNRRDQEQRAVIDRKMLIYRKSNLVKTSTHRARICEGSTMGQPPQPLPKPKIVLKDRKKTQTVSVYNHATPSGDPKVDAKNEAAHRVWVMRRINQLQTEMDEREMKDCIVMWQQNYARVEEESNRRIEGSMVACQTGRTCHQKHVTKSNEAEPEKRHPSRAQTAPLRTGSDVSDGTDAYTNAVTEGMNLPKRYEGELSLSPYDAYQPSTLDKIMHQYKDNNMLRGRNVRTPDSKDKISRLGLSPSHTPTLRSTATLNIPLDVHVDESTLVTPSLVPTLDKPLIEQVFPVLARTEEGPSMIRLQQLHMSSRIHECFARTKNKDGTYMRQSLAEIQKAILTPEDAPLEECLLLLPRATDGYMRDWNAPAKGGKGKSGKPKKAKKG